MGGPGYHVNAEFNSKPHKRGPFHGARQRSEQRRIAVFICVNDANFWIGNTRCLAKCRAVSKWSIRLCQPNAMDATIRWNASK